MRTPFPLTSFSQLQPCPICLQPFTRTLSKLPRVLLCGHQLCSDCIKNQIMCKKYLTCNFIFYQKMLMIQVHYVQKCLIRMFVKNFKGIFYMDMVDYLDEGYKKLLRVLENDANVSQCQDFQEQCFKRLQFAYKQIQPTYNSELSGLQKNNFTNLPLNNPRHSNPFPSSPKFLPRNIQHCLIDLKKCKNPVCSNSTQLIFCCQQCQYQFDQTQTKKENGYSNAGMEDFYTEI